MDRAQSDAFNRPWIFLGFVMIKIPDWSSLQSYKDRRPPWIRLHRKLLDNYKFHSMSADSRAMLPMLWLIAAEHKDPTAGIVEAEPDEIAFRLRLCNETVTKSLQEMHNAGFVIYTSSTGSTDTTCYETVTKPLRNRNETVTTETETETEAETEAETEKPLSSKPDGTVQDIFSHWQTTTNHLRSKLDAKRTKRIKAALKLGYSVDDLKLAIDGNHRSDWHQGKNDRSQVYDSIDLIFRDADKIDHFIELSQTQTNDEKITAAFETDFEELFNLPPQEKEVN